jgi:hypothetical protein
MNILTETRAALLNSGIFGVGEAVVGVVVGADVDVEVGADVAVGDGVDVVVPVDITDTVPSLEFAT